MSDAVSPGPEAGPQAAPYVSTTTRRGPSIDAATLFGLAGGFGLVATALVLGGSPQAFFDIPALLIVFGGTFAVTSICFSLPEILRAPSVLVKTVFHRAGDPSAAALQMIELAQVARKTGILSLQNVMDRVRGEPFLYEGLAMVVDGATGDDIEEVLRRELNAMANRHAKSASILRKAAEIAPAMGLIGTLVGLVQMLGNLDDPSSIGPSMAIALLTTFYGAILGYMVFMPLAAKLQRNSNEEILLRNVYLTGAVSMGRQENPRRLEMLINTLLPPAKRIRFFD